MPTLAALLVSILAQAAAPAAKCPPHLFVLERTTNKNIVVYDAKRLPSGALDPAKPAIAYWICNAEKGQREELTSIQWSRAYGFDTSPAKKPDRYRMTFKADFGRSFVVQIRDGCPVAIARIGGKKGIVQQDLRQREDLRSWSRRSSQWRFSARTRDRGPDPPRSSTP